MKLSLHDKYLQIYDCCHILEIIGDRSEPPSDKYVKWLIFYFLARACMFFTLYIYCVRTA